MCSRLSLNWLKCKNKEFSPHHLESKKELKYIHQTTIKELTLERLLSYATWQIVENIL